MSSPPPPLRVRRAVPGAAALRPVVERAALAIPALTLAVAALVASGDAPRAVAVPAPPARVAVAPLAARPAADSVIAPAASAAIAGTPRVLRVCADPNNLPFSNTRGEGFENRLAELVARDLGARLEYVWWAQRRGFLRNTIRAGRCDVVMGVPSSLEMVQATQPYYRSTYVFVTRRGGPRVRSFDDDILHRLRVGVQIVGDDYANTPPAHALATRGIVTNVRGYTLYGDYREESPPARVVRAVADREIDVAVVWGPLAGYYATRARVPLRVDPVSPQIDLPFLPFVFDVSMGVRRGDVALRDTLDRVLTRRRAEIGRLLDAYGVPRVGGSRAAASAS